MNRKYIHVCMNYKSMTVYEIPNWLIANSWLLLWPTLIWSIHVWSWHTKWHLLEILASHILLYCYLLIDCTLIKITQVGSYVLGIQMADDNVTWLNWGRNCKASFIYTGLSNPPHRFAKSFLCQKKYLFYARNWNMPFSCWGTVNEEQMIKSVAAT